MVTTDTLNCWAVAKQCKIQGVINATTHAQVQIALDLDDFATAHRLIEQSDTFVSDFNLMRRSCFNICIVVIWIICLGNIINFYYEVNVSNVELVYNL